MGCRAPIIINSCTCDESPGGLVDSVSGVGVIDVTPTTGDPVVSVIPGSDGEVLVTNGSNVEWNTPFESGTYNPNISSMQNSTIGVSTNDVKWMRIGNIVSVSGWFDASVGDATLDAEATIDSLPFPPVPGTPFPQPRTSGNVTGTSATSGGTETATGYVQEVAASPAVVRWVATTTDSLRLFYQFQYIADI